MTYASRILDHVFPRNDTVSFPFDSDEILICSLRKYVI
jgi:hypothetical protein